MKEVADHNANFLQICFLSNGKADQESLSNVIVKKVSFLCVILRVFHVVLVIIIRINSC